MQCAQRGYAMKKYTAIIILLVLTVSCKDTGTGPSSEVNLVVNSTFELNGLPSLHDWIVSDTSVVHFSTDVPARGKGYSLVFHARSLPGYNSIYTAITGVGGRHRYRLSAFGKADRIPWGAVHAYRYEPSTGNSAPFGSLEIADTVWTFYSHTDTLSTTPTDTIFIEITGSVRPIIPLTSIFFNSCKFDKLD